MLDHNRIEYPEDKKAEQAKKELEAKKKEDPAYIAFGGVDPDAPERAPMTPMPRAGEVIVDAAAPVARPGAPPGRLWAGCTVALTAQASGWRRLSTPHTANQPMGNLD